ncbi:MAG TPA: archease [Usitatibacter sp.]|nr:archease [Usitatibacter sp.]
MDADDAGGGAGYGYFDHDADVGIVGRGPDLETAFVSAAKAMFALSTDIKTVRDKQRFEIQFEEEDIEIALVRWLNLLLAHAGDRHLALGRFSLRRDGAQWRGEAWGEPWRDGLERGTELKGATLTMLRVARADGGWEARCVVDV